MDMPSGQHRQFFLKDWSSCEATPYMGEISILGFNDVSWWHGLLHRGQFFLSKLIQRQTWSAKESFLGSPIPTQDEHILLVAPGGTIPPQISHVFIAPILYRHYW